MSAKTRTLIASLALAFAGHAQASLLLDASVTSQFAGGATTSGTNGNDLPAPRPSVLYFGQLQATANGTVDIFYIGNEAGFINSFNWGANTYSTADKPDVFTSNLLIGSLSVTAGSFLDIGFCTDGGDAVGSFGRCVSNNSADSLVAQFNYGQEEGYRSIGYSSLSTYDPVTGERVFNGNPGTSDIWWAFWDDSGAKNDDNHDDMIIGLRFTPARIVSVPEPGTLGVFALGLMGAAFSMRRRLGILPTR